MWSFAQLPVHLGRGEMDLRKLTTMSTSADQGTLPIPMWHKTQVIETL